VTPYYDHDGVQIYVGDCRDVLPRLPPAFDVVMTDPPYNVGKNYGGHDDRQEPADYETWLRSVLARCADLAPSLVYTPGTKNVWRVAALLEGTGYTPHAMLGWHKKEFAGDKFHVGPAHCWEPVVWAGREKNPYFRKRFGERGRDFLVVPATHGDPFAKRHPCPKPLPVMAWLVGLFVPDGGTVLDPFAGTGTTLRAAKDAGFRAVGIELNERYAAAAVKRLEQGVLPWDSAAEAV
jgi:DNA modification methylase